jgi:hypothetical protein
MFWVKFQIDSNFLVKIYFTTKCVLNILNHCGRIIYFTYVVGRISAQFCNNCAVSEESTILTVCVDFDTSRNIRHGGICEIMVISVNFTDVLSCEQAFIQVYLGVSYKRLFAGYLYYLMFILVSKSGYPVNMVLSSQNAQYFHLSGPLTSV